MPRPLDTTPGSPTGRVGRLSALLRAGVSVPASFVVAADERADALALAHAIDELRGFPVTVWGETATYEAASAEQLTHRVAHCRASGGDVVLYRSIQIDQVGTAQSVDRAAGDDDVAVVELVPADGAGASRVRIRRGDGVVTERLLADARANLSDRLARELAYVLGRVAALAARPVEIDWVTDENGALWVLDFRPCDPPQPPAGWSRTSLPGTARVRGLFSAAFAPLVAAGQLGRAPPAVSCGGNLTWRSEGWPPPEPVGPTGTLYRTRIRRALDAHLLQVAGAEADLLRVATDPGALADESLVAYLAELDTRWAAASSGLLLLALCEGGSYGERAAAGLVEALGIVTGTPPASGVSVLDTAAVPAGTAAPRRWLAGLGWGKRADPAADFAAIAAQVRLVAGLLSIADTERARRAANPTASRPIAP